MADNNKKKTSSTKEKGRVKPNVPRAGLSVKGSRYCGGGRKKTK